MSDSFFEGGCLCGAARYRINGAPLASILCHCRSCRKASSAPSVAWLTVRPDQFELHSGELRSYASSPGVARTFCERCGSPLTYSSSGTPGELDVTTASLDDPARCPPRQELWLEHRIGWETPNPSLPQFPRDSGEGPSS